MEGTAESGVNSEHLMNIKMISLEQILLVRESLNNLIKIFGKSNREKRQKDRGDGTITPDEELLKRFNA